MHTPSALGKGSGTEAAEASSMAQTLSLNVGSEDGTSGLEKYQATVAGVWAYMGPDMGTASLRVSVDELLPSWRKHTTGHIRPCSCARDDNPVGR